eukprot:TRINITY_DN40562_c0_g1_i1.p1 TRINITY_DN40562_c0_g1~~TRINITY_DN40562_c0_g1_i1.p1  ORF type:complete len:234 (+),score=4.09 TRINITY_DN40562_c0_g1_i1:204-905(+)
MERKEKMVYASSSYAVRDTQGARIRERQVRTAIPVLNLDNVPPNDISQAVGQWGNELVICMRVNSVPEPTVLAIAVNKFAGVLRDWWFNAAEQFKQTLVNGGIDNLVNEIIQEFGAGIDPNHQIVQKINLIRRRLKDLSRFEEFSKDYIKEVYRLGISRNTTILISYLAALPAGIEHKILQQLRRENIAIQNLTLPQLVNCVRRHLEYLCSERKLQRALSKVCNSIEGVKYLE